MAWLCARPQGEREAGQNGDVGDVEHRPPAEVDEINDMAPADDVEGFAVACRTRYAGKNFDDVESDLHRDWDNRSNKSGTWDKVKDSVRRAWNRV